MIDSIPDRPLRESDLEAIRDASGWQINGGTWRFGDMSPFDEDCTEEIVIVADDWFGAYERRGDGWREVFREERDPDEDDELLYMVALEELGLA